MLLLLLLLLCCRWCAHVSSKEKKGRNYALHLAHGMLIVSLRINMLYKSYSFIITTAVELYNNNGVCASVYALNGENVKKNINSFNPMVAGCSYK